MRGFFSYFSSITFRPDEYAKREICHSWIKTNESDGIMRIGLG